MKNTNPTTTRSTNNPRSVRGRTDSMRSLPQRRRLTAHERIRACRLPFIWEHQPGGDTRMSERHKPHNGRDRSGHFKVRRTDVEDLLEDPAGTDYLKDDVRLGGAVEDTGLGAGRAGE